MKEVRLHYNIPQIRSKLINAPEEWAVMGRGTGKSEGILAPKSEFYLHSMPRSCGVMVGATYTQILTRTLPAIIYGWAKLGYHRDIHFVVGKKPTQKWIDKWKWKGPFRKPLKYEYFISWWNGSGIHLVSQDRSGSSNGITIDWIIGDEAKLLNRDKLVRDLFPANRGIIFDFKGNPYHHGKTFTTDMPVGTSGRWILDKELDMDKKRVKQILDLHMVRYKIASICKNTKNKIVLAEVKKQCDVLDAEMNEIRSPVKTKGEEKPALLYYHEASTLENLHALGGEYIKEQMRDSSDFEFDTQILNKRPNKIENGFYPDLDEDKHGYFAYNYTHIDRLGYSITELDLNDCRKDADHDTDKPLIISGDWNKAIWPLVVAQDCGATLKVINAIDVEYPLKLKEVLEKFSTYYRFHKRRVVEVYYDHTAVGELDNEPIYLKIERILTELNWIVSMIYIGQSSSHGSRYLMYAHLLKEDKHYNKILRFNRENCEYLIMSMNKAGSEYGKNGIQKNKRPEKDPKFPQREATHYSEALDTLLTGMFERNLTTSAEETSEGITVMH